MNKIFIYVLKFFFFIFKPVKLKFYDIYNKGNKETINEHN